MRFPIAVATLCVSLGTASAQVVFVTTGANAEYVKLFQRAARSTVVVTGKVVEWKAVRNRVLPEPIQVGPNMYRGGDPSVGFAGNLFTVELGETLCRGQDFTLLRLQGAVPNGTVHVVVPPDQVGRSSDVEPGISMPHAQLFEGRKYLLFLAPYPRQKELVEKNDIDANLTYYRVYDGYMGAIPLPDDAARQGESNPKVRYMNVVKQFCEAVKPPDPAEKIARLKALREKADRRWIDSVDAAIQSLEEETRP